jgi:hypothetical protein
MKMRRRHRPRVLRDSRKLHLRRNNRGRRITTQERPGAKPGLFQ